MNKLTHQWRFKEADGDWSPWYACDEHEANRRGWGFDEETRRMPEKPE